MRKQKNIIIPILFIILTVSPLMSQRAFYNEAKKHVVQISPEKAKKMIDEDNISLFDVRSKKEYESGTIKNSINIPWKLITDEIAKYVKNKNQKIIVFCYSGARGILAAYKLMKKGYEDVVNIKGGIMAWRKNKLSVVVPKKKIKNK